MKRSRLYLFLLPFSFMVACIAPAIPATVTSNPIIQDTTPETIAPIVENPAAIGPANIPAGINPLTGQPAADPQLLNRRPMVVKISNAPPLVRPQAGIGAADIVYEYYVEGGLTRFSAVFYGEAPNRVGSIRSARLIDLELMPMYGGLLAFSGASTGVEDLLNTSDFADRIYKGVLFGLPYFWRDEDIEVPHNLFMNPNALWQLATEDGVNQRPDLHGMAFLQDAPPGSSGAATDIDLRYRATRVRWKYDAEIGKYRRWADGEGHFDANTLQQVTAENVVIIYADHEYTDIVESQFQDSVSYSIAIALQGEGNAILLRDGLRYDGHWVRPKRDDMLGLQTSDGQILYFKPGKTWFQVIRLPEQQIAAEEWLDIK